MMARSREKSGNERNWFPLWKPKYLIHTQVFLIQRSKIATEMYSKIVFMTDH